MPVINNLPRQSVDYYQVLDVGMQSNLAAQSLAPTQQTSYQTGGPVRHPGTIMTHGRQYHTTVPSRPSSGAWTPAEDQTLMAARASGLNWGPIQQTYFPNKTPNACRKRHERLMERRNADEWDGVKLELLGKEYMELRREIWAPLAERTGEKWTVVEAKCMASGLKNLQSAARSYARRERLETSSGIQKAHHMSHSRNHSHSSSYDRNAAYCRYTDDSAILLEDHDSEYLATDSASYHSDDRTGSSPTRRTARLSAGEASMATSAALAMNAYRDVQVQSRGPYVQHRLPSLDMGIGSIINRQGGASC